MTLEEFILLPHRWQWGFCDCTLFPADWVQAATGRDPGARLRGTYFDAAGAQAVLERAGGAEALVERELEALGFAQTQEPRDGDVGMVSCLTALPGAEPQRKLVPGIMFGPLWATMSARGPQVKAWKREGAAWRIA